MKDSGTILLVDDDLVDRMAFERFARKYDFPYSYKLAGSVKEASEILKTEQFDTVILDYRLGDGTAFDLFDQLNDIPFILVTGIGNEEVAVRAMKAGAVDYLVKDPDSVYLQALPHVIEKAINNKRNELELTRYRQHLEELVEERTARLTREIAERKSIEADLKQYRDHLEVLVQARTGELEKAKIITESANIALRNEVEERKQSQKALKESETHLKTILDSIQNGVVFIDADSRKIIDVNPAACKMIGTSKEQIVGNICHKFICAAESDNCPILDLGQKGDNSERKLLTVHGKIIPIIKNVTVMVLGGHKYLVESFIDITDRKRFEEELQDAYEKLKELDKLKTEYLSNVSHELRTPLTSVLGFAEIIKRKLTGDIFPHIKVDDPKIQRSVKQVSGNIGIVISEGERLTALINDVLDIAKMEAGKVLWKKETVSIDEVIDQSVAATHTLFDQKNIELLTEVDNALPEVEGDKDRLIQVMINLIANAVKFTEKGTVTIKAEGVSNTLVISVIDTGAGIALEDFGKVFERFKQTTDISTGKPMGTGLGLPICKKIVEYHKGNIRLESEKGRGSIFSFTLPVKK